MSDNGKEQERKEKALTTALTQIERSYGKGAIMRMGADGTMTRAPIRFQIMKPRRLISPCLARQAIHTADSPNSAPKKVRAAVMVSRAAWSS